MAEVCIDQFYNGRFHRWGNACDEGSDILREQLMNVYSPPPPPPIDWKQATTSSTPGSCLIMNTLPFKMFRMRVFIYYIISHFMLRLYHSYQYDSLLHRS